MAPEDTTPEQDTAAVQWAVGVLQSDPDITYKELRREARVQAGLSLSRRAWTAARRELGLVSAEDMEGGSAHEAPDRGAAVPERAPARDRESAQPRPPVEYRGQRRPAWAAPARTAPWAQPLPARTEPPPTATIQARTAIEFMVEYLRTVKLEASFQEVQAAAEKAGFTIYPATFGRAQAMVGLVEASKPVVLPPASPAPAPEPALRAAPAAAPSQAGIDPEEGLRAFFDAYRRAHLDRARIRRLMRDMLEVAQAALESTGP
jgi:hypothetical protein